MKVSPIPIWWVFLSCKCCSLKKQASHSTFSLSLSLFPILYTILRKTVAFLKGTGETETAIKESAVNGVSDTADYSKKT